MTALVTPRSSMPVPGPPAASAMLRPPSRTSSTICPASAPAAGDAAGTRIRLAGEGEEGGRGGPGAYLYICLAISAHPFFQREGADLHCRVAISMVLAAPGGDIEVPTIDGNHSRVKVPESAEA